MGRKPDKTPGAQAYPLDPDINPWDPQPDETPAQYKRFKAYLDSDNRVMKEHSAGGASQEPHRWSWGYRAYQYDLYMAKVDEQEMVRYRRLMNHRQRAAGRAAQAKALQWLQQADPTTLKPREATRLLEVAVRIERDASGTDEHASTAPAEHGYDSAVTHADTQPGHTLADLLGSDDVAAAEIASMLARLESNEAS